MERGTNSELPLSAQSDLLGVSRASLYYQPRSAGAHEVAVKRRLDELYTAHPFLGSRKVGVLLSSVGLTVGRHTIRRYRQEMGLETLYPKPNLSKAAQGVACPVFPYLLRGLAIDRPNQVWGVDITYVRLLAGWVYLVAFLDWHSRFVVAWELSDTLELAFVLTCSQAALGKAVPEIVNSDQGSHFTSEGFTTLFLAAGTRVSRDGRGRYVDNIFTERLWRSVKYEEVYLTEYDSPRAARVGIGQYLSFYNERRPHQALGYRTPKAVYEDCSSGAGNK